MSPAKAVPPSPHRRGPLRSLTRDRVVLAALAELRENGVDAVSFRSVARRLGVNPMTLYTYVADKDELLAAMFDHVFGAVGDLMPEVAADEPRAAVIVYFVACRRLMVEYKDLYRLVRPTGTGMDRALAERVCRVVADVGVARNRVADVHLALLELTIGSALVAAEVRLPLTGQHTDDLEHPLLSTVFRRAEELDPEDHFVHTLGLLLDAFANGGNHA